MKYIYETHCHTMENSRCSRITAKELVELYVSKNYTGIVITDHFTGPTTVPSYYNWKERVEHFHQGFEAAKNEGEKLGLDVFFSLEYTDLGNDFLLYGIERDFLLENPDLPEIGMTAVLQRAREAGAFIIHAHPFLEADYIDSIRLVPNHVDAVEVMNVYKGENYNKRALWYAEEYGLLKTGGSDMHHFNQKLSGITVEHRAESILDLAEQIKAGKSEIL